MALELPRDARRLKVGLLVAAALAAGTLALAAARASRPEFRAHQGRFAERFQDPGGALEVEACSGAVDRCTSCHLGAEKAELKSEPQPLRAHSVSLAAHPPSRFGCASCHGGEPRALTASAAHAGDPRMKAPHVEASCGACHVPQRGKGMDRLADGARLFVELGCGTCHPLAKGGRGGWDFGPDLRSLGRKSPAYFEKVLLDPTSVIAGATMPSFRGTLAQDPRMLGSLVVFLESLALPRPKECNARDKSAALASTSCTRCHTGAVAERGGAAWHRCDYLRDRSSELSCRACHPKEIPAGASECPTVLARRASCAACHDGAGERAP